MSNVNNLISNSHKFCPQEPVVVSCSCEQVPGMQLKALLLLFCAYLHNNKKVFVWHIADASHIWLHSTP